MERQPSYASSSKSSDTPADTPTHSTHSPKNNAVSTSTSHPSSPPVKAFPSPSSTQCQNAHSKTGSRPPPSRNPTTEPTKNATNNINSYPIALSALFALFHQFPHPKVQRMQIMQSGLINPTLYDYICRKKHGKRYGIYRIL